MKNCTRKSLYLTLLAVLMLAAPRVMKAQVNCATFTTAGTPATLTPTSNWQLVTTQSNRYYEFNATAGCTYTFSHCQGGGSAPIGTDPALTITDPTNTAVAYNNDGTCASNGESHLVFTATSTGVHRIHHEKCCCTQAGSPHFATMAYKVECPCVPGVAFASPTSMCAGGSVTLTLSGNSPGSTFQWQQSTNNINFTNIAGATTTPYVYGPLVAGTYYFRAYATCTGVGNNVGVDTTASVQVVVNALPTVIFPPQPAPNCCNNAAYALNTATPVGGFYSGTGVTGVGPYNFNPNQVCNNTVTITYTYTDGNGCTNTATQPYTVNDTPAVTFSPFPNGYCFTDPNIYPLTLATPPGGTYDDFMTSNTLVSGTNLLPNQAPSPGTYPIGYTYTNNGCSSTEVQNVTIFASPLLNFPNPGNMCVNTPSVQLNATPAGGTYSDVTFPGDVTSGGLFTPNNAGVHTISYSYTDGNGCNSNQSINITVYNYPAIIQQVAFPTLCENSTNLNLNAVNYFTPIGGTYGSSTGGVSGNILNPTGQCVNSPKWITYTVSQNGCTSIDSAQIIINCVPTVTQLNPIPPVCVGSAPFDLAPYFTPAGGTFSCGGCAYLTGTMFNPTNVVNQNMTYTWSNGTCANSVSFQVQVINLPNVNQTPIADVCLGLDSFMLTGGSPAGGVYTANCGACVQQQGGNYYFYPGTSGADTFMVYYTYPSTGLCTNIDSAEVIVHPGPSINFPPLADVCDGDPLVQLLATPSGAGGTFSSPTPGAVVNPGPNQWYFDPTVGPGTYQIRYVFNDGTTGCVDSAFQNIIVKPRPGAITISNLVNPTTCGTCNGSLRINGLNSNTNYVLQYERNGVLQGPFSIVSTGIGTYTVTGLCAATYGNVTIYLNGCSQLNAPPAVQLVDPNAPPAPVAGSNSPLCQFSTLQLTATTTVTNPSFTWTGPNSFFSNQQNPAIFNAQTAASGVYNVTVTDNQNCTSMPTVVNVVVNPAPDITISSNAPVCAGNTLTLNASSTVPGTTFQWTGPSGFFSPVANPSLNNVTTANQGWYHAVATSPNNCTRADSLQVIVGTVTPVTPVAGANTPVCSGATLNLTATNSTPGATYNWSGPTGFTSLLQNPNRPMMTLADSGDYAVFASLDGCTSNTSIVHVSVIQSLTPAISITANPDDTVCFGTNIDFTATTTDGGTAPQFQWYKNGVPVIGALDSFWGSPYLTDLDTVWVVLTNATTCTTSSTDTSNKITVHMAPNTIPTVNLGSYPFEWVAGQNMTFYANVLNAGTNPAFQWFLNGTLLVGETASTYSSSSLLATDTLSVLVTSNAPCAIPDTASDNWNAVMNLSITASGVVIEDMKLYPNPNTGAFVLSGSFKGMTGVKDADIEIVNAVGQVVFKDKALVNNGKIDKQVRMNSVAPGAYILRVNADGQTSQLRFLVN